MAFVIATINQKGGSGKTTLTAHLARAASLDGLKVLLVDSDRQGSLRDWHAAGNGCGLDLVAADTPSAISSVRNIGLGYDVVFIDGMPSANAGAAAAIRVSDGVLIPVQPSPLDVWACGEVVDLVKQRREVANGLPRAGLVVSRAITRSVLARGLIRAFDEIGLESLDTHVHQRVMYATSMAIGSTALDDDPTGLAALEMRSIFREVRKAWLS